MSISFESHLGYREHALRLRAERATVLSSNLANVDTPNFKARDIDFKSEYQSRIGQSSQVQMRSSNNMHMSLDGIGGGGSERLYRLPTQPSIDGNSVEEHVEHAEFMKNSLEFQVAFTMLSGSFKSLQKAVRGD